MTPSGPFLDIKSNEISAARFICMDRPGGGQVQQAEHSKEQPVPNRSEC